MTACRNHEHRSKRCRLIKMIINFSIKSIYFKCLLLNKKCWLLGIICRDAHKNLIFMIQNCTAILFPLTPFFFLFCMIISGEPEWQLKKTIPWKTSESSLFQINKSGKAWKSLECLIINFVWANILLGYFHFIWFLYVGHFCELEMPQKYERFIWFNSK